MKPERVAARPRGAAEVPGAARDVPSAGKRSHSRTGSRGFGFPNSIIFPNRSRTNTGRGRKRKRRGYASTASATTNLQVMCFITIGYRKRSRATATNTESSGCSGNCCFCIWNFPRKRRRYDTQENSVRTTRRPPKANRASGIGS